MAKFLYTGSTSRTTSAIARQFPMFGKGKPILFWAERGLIKFEDQREHIPVHKRFGAMFWQIAAKNVLGLSEMVMKSSEDRRWAAERQDLQRFIGEMEAVIREAREQGGPLDGAMVRREYKRRRPTTVVKPTIVNLD